MKNKMMREYVSGTNTLVSLDSPELFPKDATCHTRNAEKWNDFHEDSATRDSGRREYSHKELGDRKHDKLVEERHLEGPSGKADQWRQSEYFESNKVGARARVLRKEHALNEQNEHVSRDDGTTRKTSTHSSTVHVSTRMTTNTALGEGGMDLLSLEDHSPLDHSPQKGKGSLGKQGALNQRRRPTKGSWRLNTSPERELNGDTYINDVTNSTTNLRSLSSDVEKQNAENYWRSKTSVNNDTSKYQTYSKKIVNDVTTVDSKNRNWIRHKRDTNKAEDLRSSGTPIVGSAFCGTRTPPSEPTTRSSRVTDRKQNNNVIVLDTGTWTKKDKTSPERLVRESTTNKVTRDSQWTKNTYNRDFKQSSPMSTTTPEQFPRKFTLHEDKDYKTTKGTAFTSDRRMHSEVSSSDHSNFNSADKYKKSYGVDKSKPVSQGVTIVEGPTTKVVSSFTHNDTTWKKTLDTTSQRYGTYNKKERTSSERSPPTEVTINGTHPPTHSPTSSSKNRSSGSPGPTQRSPRPRTNEPNRKLGTEPATKSEDRRTVIMNEIRSFDPKKLRKQRESTKVGTTTSWLEERYAAHKQNHVVNTHRDKVHNQVNNGSYLERRSNGTSTKIHLSPDQKKPSYPNQNVGEKSTNPVYQSLHMETNVRPFERTQSLPILESKVTVREEVNNEYLSSFVTADEEEEDDVEDELQWERFSDSGEEELNSSWVIQRNIDWEKLEHKETFEDQNILWKNRMDVLRTSPGPRQYWNENFYQEQVYLRPVSPATPTKSNSSFYFPEVELRTTSSPNKSPPTSFTVPQVHLRQTPSLSHPESESFTVPQVQLRRTPSLPRQNSKSFQLPEVSLRRTPSLPRLETQTFYVPEVQLRRTPSLPHLEHDHVSLPDFELRRTPSGPRLTPEPFWVPNVHLRRTPSLPKLDSYSFQIPEVSLRRTPSLPRLPPESFQLPEFRLRRTPSLPNIEPDSFQLESVMLRHIPQNPRSSPEFFQVPHISLNPVPHTLPSPEIEHFTLPAVNLNPTHLWVAKDDTTDSYGYSQSELVFMDEDQDSDRWSPRPFSPNVLRGRSPRAISPSIERNWSDQNVEPSWVQIANEKQVRSLNWELMDQQDTGNASGNPWKDVSLREIKKYVPDSQLESQESVSSWEWVDTNELMSKSHEDEQPEWVELAQQRQHKYEQHEIDESLRRSTPSPIIPTWKTQIRLRATPGVPTKDDVEIKTDYAIMREKLRSPTFVERQSTVVKPEWLQNVKLKKTSHLTEVKGPKVGRVVSPQFTERPKSPVVDQTYIHHIVRPRSPERSASPPPMTTTFTTTRRAADDISVDRVLSSIRLIREASASYPNLRETAYSTGHEFSTSPAWRIEKKLSPTTKYETFPRPTSPSYARRSPDVIDVSTAESFATPPQWLTDLKSRVKHKRLQELSSPTEETSFKFDKRLTSPTSTYNKRRSWSPRTNFTNVLEEIRSVNPSEILTDVHTSRRYGSLRRNTERPQQRARAESPTYNRSSSPRERPPSPTEKFTEEKHQPATWWVQVPSQIDASDSESRLRKFEAFLQKRVTSPPSRSYSKPFYTGRVFGKSPSSSPPGRRTPSPPSRRSPSPHERSESPTCSRYLAHLDRAQSSSDTNLASISTSPQRPITTTTTTTQSPTKTTKIVVTPKTSSPSRVVTKKTTPKARQHPAKTITTKATRSSPSSTGDQKLKSSPGKQRTTLTISAVQSRVQQESKAAREKSNVSPQKFPTSPSKTTITSKKTENKERPSRQMTVNRSTTPLSSTRTSPKTTSSDASIAKGRFSQLLTELSSPPSTLTRSESLKSKTSSRQAEKASTFPKRSTQSTTTAKSGSFTSASLVRQVNTASSGTYNIRKPRVRFSATEIVWPLDQDGHSPAVTTCHHPIRVTE